MSFCHATDSVRFTGRVGEKGILFGVAETTKVRKNLWLLFWNFLDFQWGVDDFL
jgi:hypothetical protein